MANIRLYKQFYYIENANLNSGSTYNLIDPFSVSASTKTAAGTGSTFVESYLTPTRESLGVYYVDLNPRSYSYDVVYELSWFTTYVENSPEKILPTRFRIEPYMVGSMITTQLESSTRLVIL